MVQKILGVLANFRKSRDWVISIPEFAFPYSRSKSIPSDLDLFIRKTDRELEEVVDVYWEVEGCCVQISDT